METVEILAVGDVVIGRNRTAAREALAAILERVPANVRFGNLEVPLTQRGTPAPKITAWRSAPEVAQDLKQLGFDVLSTANNHALDYGREGLFDTLAALRQAGIRQIGSGAEVESALAPATIETDSVRLAFMAVACTLPLGFDADGGRPGIAPIHVRTSYEFDPIDAQEEPGCIPTYIHTVANAADVSRICERVRGLKDNGYTTLVSLHWGNAYQKRLARYQPALARELAEAGCDMIIGHHLHTIHAIDVIGRMPVLYSLGNCVMDVTTEGRTDRDLLTDMAISWEPSPDALVASICVDPGGIRRLDILPLAIDDNGLPFWPAAQAGAKTLAETMALSGGSIPQARLEDDRITIHPFR